MGNCGSKFTEKYCNELLGEELEADPDILGPGVLAAFTVTAVVTFAAIIFGYFNKCLPDAYLKPADTVAIDSFNNSRFSQLCGRIFHKPFRRIFPGIIPIFKSRNLSRTQRENALEKFVLTLSDQQLVTGLAILIGAFANHCRLSIYEFNVVIALAWFSSLTHLATLDVLQGYFQQNHVVRNWRVAAMVLMLALLIVAQILSLVYVPYNSPVPMQCLTTSSDLYDSADFLSIYALVFTIFYLLFSYYNRIRLSSSRGVSRPRFLSKLNLVVLIRSGALPSGLSHSERLSIVDKLCDQFYQNQKAALFSPPKQRLLRPIAFLRQSFAIYQETFLSKIGALAFSLSYGISQVVTIRSTYPPLKEGSKRMDFGQIVPLVLLALPVLIAAEIYYENPDDPPNTPPPEDGDLSKIPDDGSPVPSPWALLAFFVIHVALVSFIGTGLNVNNQSAVVLASVFMLAYGASLTVDSYRSALLYARYTSGYLRENGYHHLVQPPQELRCTCRAAPMVEPQTITSTETNLDRLQDEHDHDHIAGYELQSTSTSSQEVLRNSVDVERTAGGFDQGHEPIAPSHIRRSDLPSNFPPSTGDQHSHIRRLVQDGGNRLSVKRS